MSVIPALGFVALPIGPSALETYNSGRTHAKCQQAEAEEDDRGTMYSLSRGQIFVARVGRAVDCCSKRQLQRGVQLKQQGTTPLRNCKGLIGAQVGLLKKGAQRSRFSVLKEGAMVGGGVSEPQRSISHVIFDMDGLLLNTENEYTAVQQKILERYGKKYDWTLKSKMMGKKAFEAVQMLIHDMGLEGVITPEEFFAEQERMLESIFPNVDVLPGVERLIRHLHSKGVPICVATSSGRRMFNLKTTKHGDLFSLMHHVVTGDDPAVKKSKPSPDIFIVALERFNEPHLTSEHALVFEDSPGGVGAAVNAKMPVVMVPHKNLDPKLHAGASQGHCNVALSDRKPPRGYLHAKSLCEACFTNGHLIFSQKMVPGSHAERYPEKLTGKQLSSIHKSKFQSRPRPRLQVKPGSGLESPNPDQSQEGNIQVTLNLDPKPGFRVTFRMLSSWAFLGTSSSLESELHIEIVEDRSEIRMSFCKSTADKFIRNTCQLLYYTGETPIFIASFPLLSSQTHCIVC